MHNAVLLVWGSLRVAPIRYSKHNYCNELLVLVSEIRSLYDKIVITMMLQQLGMMLQNHYLHDTELFWKKILLHCLVLY